MLKNTLQILSTFYKIAAGIPEVAVTGIYISSKLHVGWLHTMRTLPMNWPLNQMLKETLH